MSNIERIREALQYVDPRDRDTWLRMGMAIKSMLADTGFEVWEDWSRQADSFNAKDAQDVWKSIQPSGKISIGTLFYTAQENGWQDHGVHQKPSPEESVERQRLAAERAAQWETEITCEREKTAKKARAIWDATNEAKADHPYLEGKKVSPVATLREIDAGTAASILGYVPKSGGDLLLDRLLVVPVKRGDGLSTLELIDGTGRKTALAGRGSKTGGYWSTDRLPEDNGEALTLLIGEGVATVLSAREATSHPAIAALSSGNLPAVAKTMRERYPGADIVILADLVKATGESDHHAIEAAKLSASRLAFPDFGAERASNLTDFNDLALLLGYEAVKACIGRATSNLNAASEEDPLASANKPRVGVQMIQASTVKMESVTWLWDGYLAMGKFHLLGGAPATGKTTISMSLAATVSNGGKWADGSRCEQGNVVIWSSEDSPEDTLVPRLALCGADLSKIYFVGDVVDGKGERPFDPATDFAPLAARLIDIGNVRLLIIDPIVSAIQGDSHKNAEVRRGLQPLVDLAMDLKCALLGITHFSKGTGGREPTERITGSLAFGALARIVLVTAKHQSSDTDEKPKRIFTRAKSNISPDGGGFEYDIENGEVQSQPGVFSSKISWGVSLEGSARDLLAEADEIDTADSGACAEAIDFLSDVLAQGSVPSKVIKDQAKAEGISKRTLERASKKLGVKSERSNFGGGTVWYLPNPENQSVAPREHSHATYKSMAQMANVGANGGFEDIVEVEL